MLNGRAQNLDTRASALMVLLCMVLGLQQVVLKIAAPDISPIMQIALRSGLSAVLVLPLLWRDHSIHLFSYRQCKLALLLLYFFIRILFRHPSLKVYLYLSYSSFTVYRSILLH